MGVIITFPLVERRGRKPTILFSAIFYTIGSILMAANFGSLSEMLVGRILSGGGSGAGMTVGPIYISEVAPLELRGTMTTFYNVNIMGGVAGSYWMNYVSQGVIPASSNWQWRIVLILQLIPSIVLFVGSPFFPESPRYLMMRGRMEVAQNNLSKLRGGLSGSDGYVAAEVAELRSKVNANAEIPGRLRCLQVSGEAVHSACTHPQGRILCAIDPTVLHLLRWKFNHVLCSDNIGINWTQLTASPALHSRIRLYQARLRFPLRFRPHRSLWPPTTPLNQVHNQSGLSHLPRCLSRHKRHLLQRQLQALLSGMGSHRRHMHLRHRLRPRVGSHIFFNSIRNLPN